MAAATRFPILPNNPFHPPQQYSFPKRAFGKTKPVMCHTQHQWFKNWPFLHYDEAQDVVFCHTCVAALRERKLTFSKNVASAFVTKGFCGWKDATVAFKKHHQYKAHSEAVQVMVTLPKTTKDVGELLDRAHKTEKEEATVMLLHILSSIRFLATR